MSLGDKINNFLVLKVLKMPDLDQVNYKFVIRPQMVKLKAWDKLEECERRYLMYEWAESLNNINNPRYRNLIKDSTSAFLLSFESAIQFIREEIKKEIKVKGLNFDNWIEKIPEYDLKVKGLRTLRILEAHIESTKSGRRFTFKEVGNDKKNVHSKTHWELAAIGVKQNKSLDHKKMEEYEVEQWNTLVMEKRVLDIFADSLKNLKVIVEEAEKLV